MYIWLKAFHLIAMVCWFSGLFYLPRLFVYHSMSEDEISHKRFCVMERKLYNGITTPSMIFTVLLGYGLLHTNFSGYLSLKWMQIKLVLVGILLVYHFMCGHYLKQFANNANTRSHMFFRFFNEFPVFILISVICLAVVKPTL